VVGVHERGVIAEGINALRDGDCVCGVCKRPHGCFLFVCGEEAV